MNRFTRFVAHWYLRAAGVPSFWSDKLSWGGLISTGTTTSGLQVTPESALSLTAAYAAINTIATDVSSLPLRVYKRRPDGGRDEDRSHPVAELLTNSPDGETTAMRWMQAVMGHALGHGNGYAEITFGGGRPAGLYLLDPRTRADRRPQDKKLFYRLPDGTTLPPGRVLHFAGLGFDGLSGYSPIKLAREAIGLGLAAQQFGSSFFGNGAHPSGFLSTDKKMNEEAVKEFRKEWNDRHQGAGKGNGVAILTNGWKWTQTTIAPEDAQFLATRQFQVVEIARIYRVPPHKIGDYTQSHLANIEASNLDYLMTTLMPWCETIEQELNRKLFTKEERAEGYYVEHNMSALLRGDMKARAEFYTRLRDLGVLTPNMICQLENLNPIGPEGDIRLVPMNMATLQDAGKPQDSKKGEADAVAA